MSQTWRNRPLRDCVKFLSGGTPNKSRSDFWEGEIPWVSSGEMAQTRIYDTALHISQVGAEEGSRLVPANTVLIVVRGMSLAKECRVTITKREVAFNQDLKALQCREDVDPEFLFYALMARREDLRDLATEAAHGTKRLQTEMLQGYELPIPSVDAQRRIASVLTAYDDLLENNERRIALLEESARLLYRDWFVRLRFPGYEHRRLTDSPLGKIPKTYQERGITLIRSLNVYDNRFQDDGLAFLNDDQASELSHVAVEPRDILLNITGASVARCCMVPELLLPARVNQHVMIVRINPALADPYFVLSAINSEERKRQLLAYAQVGATREALTKETVTNFQIVLPDEHLLRDFAQVARNLFRQREVLAHQNGVVEKARNLLLPRLMSGEITV